MVASMVRFGMCTIGDVHTKLRANEELCIEQLGAEYVQADSHFQQQAFVCNMDACMREIKARFPAAYNKAA